MGLVAGGFIGFHALGMELPDHAELLPFCMLVGAGAGWLIGAGLGSIVAKDARPPGTTGRRLLLVGAVVVLIGALAIAISPVPAGWPNGGVRFFWYWASEAGALAGIAILIDAAIAVATFWVVSRDRERSGHPGRFVGAISIAGLILGWLLFALALWTVARSWASTLDHQQYRVAYRTTSSLADAAGRRLERTGTFPKDLDDVLAARGAVQPGVVVESRVW